MKTLGVVKIKKERSKSSLSKWEYLQDIFYAHLKLLPIWKVHYHSPQTLSAIALFWRLGRASMSIPVPPELDLRCPGGWFWSGTGQPALSREWVVRQISLNHFLLYHQSNEDSKSSARINLQPKVFIYCPLRRWQVSSTAQGFIDLGYNCLFSL